MCSMLHSNIVSLFSFLIFVIVPWLRRKIHLSVQMHAEIVRNKGDVSLPQTIHQIYVCVFL